MPICQYEDGRLFLVDTHAYVPDVTLYGVNVYTSDARELMRMLEERNGGANHWYEIVVFDKIGVNASVFYSIKEDSFFSADDDVQDDRGLAIYQVGADADTANLPAISFLDR